MTQKNVSPLGENESLDKLMPLFPISVVADILKVHQRTLRIYDEESILEPARSGKNRRLYSYVDIQKGQLIQYLTRDLGINLAGVKVIIYLLKEAKVNENNYLAFVQNVAAQINITPEIQAENKIKSMKRGRKPSKK